MRRLPSDLDKGIEVQENTGLEASQASRFPGLITREGEHAEEAFFNFFTATIRNPNTRRAYGRAVAEFLTWCERYGVERLAQVRPAMVAAYIESHPGAPLTKKQQLATIRHLFDWLVVQQVIEVNPASSVRGPKYVIRKGKTPVLSKEDARLLLESIGTATIKGLRDRALIGVMLYSFARVGAVLGMNVEDYHQTGSKSWSLRLHEKGGRYNEVPAHRKAQEYLDAYLDAANLWEDKKNPIFRTINRHRQLTHERLDAPNALRMIKKRAGEVGLPTSISPHSFRATGITVYLENGGKLEVAQTIAGHESPRATRLYDRRGDKISMDEIEKINYS